MLIWLERTDGQAKASWTYNVKLTAAVMNGHASSFAVILAIPEQLIHKLRECKAALLENARFSILTEDDVLRDQGGS